jgi:hypothetical protein
MSIDAGRDSAANLNEHRQGILSGQQIAAEQGYDYFTTLEQKAVESAKVSELARKYGVPETAIQLTTSSLPSTPAAAAASGTEVGAAAAQAQAASTPTANAPAEMSSAITVAQLITTTKPMREARAKLAAERLSRSAAIRARFGAKPTPASRV